MKRIAHRMNGFTLVEIILVLMIIGILATIAIPSFLRARESSQANACISNMNQLFTTIELNAMEGRDHDVDNVNEFLRGIWDDYNCNGKVYVLPANSDVLPVCPTPALRTQDPYPHVLTTPAGG